MKLKVIIYANLCKSPTNNRRPSTVSIGGVPAQNGADNSAEHNGSAERRRDVRVRAVHVQVDEERVEYGWMRVL